MIFNPKANVNFSGLSLWPPLKHLLEPFDNIFLCSKRALSLNLRPLKDQDQDCLRVFMAALNFLHSHA